ncbi:MULTISPECIES: ribosome assembly cofactor RimP [Flavobacterium]|uniref:ribosome assembly cofactor RimP n=1 Tax=Flavobacterium TaxID=237 RepID=UPI001FCB7F6C|nr:MULTISPECIES: ribosome assembly cofactor RimP [Flavobacterium]UOK43986.1 ribosome assembly cofactor RimP [Flavobacterium enshiense]
MTFKEKVSGILEEALEQKPSLFLIDLTITDAFKIIVTLDGDNGVTLQDCIDVSRVVENGLDREEQDFLLEVASAGATSPLRMPRQFKKNIGRKLKVTTAAEKIEANITDANDEFIVLEWTAREPKQIGKGKETVQKRAEIKYEDIKEAIVIITF